METTFHLFTYGTLASDDASGAAAELLSGCRRLVRATVRGSVYDIGPYPALLLAGRDEVEGEIWRCPARVLARLDRYEGVEEGLFRRVGLRVDGVPCWTYVAGPALGPRLLPASRIDSRAYGP